VDDGGAPIVANDDAPAAAAQQLLEREHIPDEIGKRDLSRRQLGRRVAAEEGRERVTARVREHRE
jgi:hypothetical protein